MDSYFTYEKPVSGKAFVGRKMECQAVCNLLMSGQHIVLYEPPKSGKSSLLHQSLLSLQLNAKPFNVCRVNAMGSMNMQHFLTRFGNCVIRSCVSTPDEYARIVQELLPGTHFVFDRQRFADADEVVSSNWDLDANDALEMFRLPARLAARDSLRLAVIVDEFQNIEAMDDGAVLLRCLKKVLQEESCGSSWTSSFIFCGSRYNAMKEIFGRGPMFHGLVSHVSLGRIEDMEISEYIRKGVNISGKVIEKDALLSIIKHFDSNMWYINHFMSICDARTKGYFNDSVFSTGLECLLAIHEPRYMGIMANLTGHQVSLLKAIIDGVTRFTASDVIRSYSLNSSANVSRVKDALMKKEIISFTDKDEPVILDILFRYWLENRYFVK